MVGKMTLRELDVARRQARQLLRVIDAACEEREPYPMLPHDTRITGDHILALRPSIPALIALLESLK